MRHELGVPPRHRRERADAYRIGAVDAMTMRDGRFVANGEAGPSAGFREGAITV